MLRITASAAVLLLAIAAPAYGQNAQEERPLGEIALSDDTLHSERT